MTEKTPGQAERERFAAKMETLADWFDADDFAKGRPGRTEVQEDLRRWAAAARDLAAQQPQPAPDLVAVRKADLDVLMAACARYLPPGLPPETAGAFARLTAVFAAAHRDDPEGSGCACYREPSPHPHDSDEDGDCLVCGCGRHQEPEPEEGE